MPPGVARVTNRHGSDEALAIVCGTPRGIHNSPPGLSVPRRSPSLYASSAPHDEDYFVLIEHIKRIAWVQCGPINSVAGFVHGP